MKKYYHPLEGKKRFMGYNSGDVNLSIQYSSKSDYKGEKPHIHTESEEIYLTLRGRATIWVNGKIHRLKPGNPIKIEKNEPHAVLSVSKGPFDCSRNYAENRQMRIRRPALQ